MFGLLNTTQIYGIQQQQHQVQVTQQQLHVITSNLVKPTTTTKTSPSSAKQQISHQQQHRRTHSSVSDTGNRFFASLASKSPTNFIEKLLKTDFLSTYDTIKNYRNYSQNSSQTTNKRHSDPLYYESGSKLKSFNCLQGSYRHSFDGDFYVPVQVNNNSNCSSNNNTDSTPKDFCTKTEIAEMTIKCSKNLLAVDAAVEQGPATLQNYQKIPESEHDLLVDSLVASSGASSGEFNSSSDGAATITGNASSSSSSGHSGSSSLSSSNLYKRLSFGGRNTQNNTKTEKNAEAKAQTQQQQQQQDAVTLNLSSSSITPTLKSIDLHRSSSSTSSLGDFLSKRERKKGAMTPQPEKTPLSNLLSPSSHTSDKDHSNANTTITPEKAQRRKLLQILSSYDQQNKLLQRELAKEKRRRTEELACVVKSLLCFEAKLKNDMKTVNQRLQEKDVEICRLVRQNRTLRKKLSKLQKEAGELAQDEGVVEDDVNENGDGDGETKDLLEDCLVLEALQCINCRKQFYDIEVTDNCTQTLLVGSGSIKDSIGSRNNDQATTEHGSSSDDTVSSSFFGARRSVRYTSKRTSGTFRDYMRSRAMNIDDPALEADLNSEVYSNTISRDNSQASYDKLHIYSRTMERMHGVKSESERDSEHSGLDASLSITRSNSRASTKSSKSTISTATSKASEISQNFEEDDGIFSPTQDEDFEEETELNQEGSKLKTVRGRALEAFSEASPKQIYETSTDDWYASASDQEEITGTVSAKPYGQGAVNPVLECVNQILLQQSMEGIEERSQTPKNSTTLPRRSSLSDRRNQRSNSKASDGATPGSRNGTLTRKRVHFSTKNSMVHVPRNDETEEDEDEGINDLKSSTMISNYQGMTSAYIIHSPALENSSAERLETFNYESIYSNEYEPIGSELNSSNLYVDMDSTTSKTVNSNNQHISKPNKLPPALPPKPANLLKFKKTLQQLDESPDEHLEAHNSEILVEPDYCSISEVNVGITSVQIKADIHRTPLSERDLESVIEQENDLDAATVVSEAASQKTEEIEEIFADIPKLPNVAAIIAPKSALKQNDYLIMSPKTDTKLGVMALTPSSICMNSTGNKLNTCTPNKADRNALKLNLTPIHGILTNSLKATKVETSGTIRPQLSSANYQQQYKRKHMPNILQEINKRLSLPNSPITPTTPKCSSLYGKANNNEPETLASLPLQAEFDWYNLDAEYGKNSHQTEIVKVNESLNTGMPTLLADIKEDGESLITAADEYNLDEEFKNELEQEHVEETNSSTHFIDSENLCEAKNSSNLTKTIKIKNNLANFEKFIETTSLTSKPLTTKRKIYFAGPFV